MMMKIAIVVTLLCVGLILMGALERSIRGMDPATFCEAYRYSVMRDVPAQCYAYFVNPPTEKK